MEEDPALDEGLAVQGHRPQQKLGRGLERYGKSEACSRRRVVGM